MNRGLTRVAVTLGALFYGLPGLWAFFAPKSFADNVATFPPYSRHLVHDMGSFMIGLAVALVAAMIWSDAVNVAFAGVATASAFSGIAHLLDHGLGGRLADPIFLFGLAVLLVVAMFARRAERSPEAEPSSGSAVR